MGRTAAQNDRAESRRMAQNAPNGWSKCGDCEKNSDAELRRTQKPNAQNGPPSAGGQCEPRCSRTCVLGPWSQARPPGTRHARPSQSCSRPSSKAPKAKAKAKGKAKAAAKGKAAPKAVGRSSRAGVVRKASLHQLRASDKMLLQTLGFGLAFFLPREHEDRPLLERPLLVLNQDEGSPNTAAFWYFTRHLGGRMHFIRDPFHREWNDCKLALQHSKMWNVVLLMMLTFNVAYGPWEGQGWFSKVRAGALELFSKLVPSDPLWQAFYTAICQDLGEAPGPSADHMEEVMKRCSLAEASSLKGPRANGCCGQSRLDV